MNGPGVRPLPPGTVYAVTEISQYIRQVLQQFDREGAYGIFAGVGEYGGDVTPTIIFGIPEANLVETVLPPAPNNFPTLVRNDWIVAINQFDAAWAIDPVYSSQEICLEPVSVGIEGSEIGAGSFGGFVRSPLEPGRIFGITAAHCVPGALVGVPICSPSTLEVTSRFRRLLRYTTICPPTDQLRFNQSKDLEAKNLLERFRLQDATTGIAFLDPADQPPRFKKGILSGDPLGSIVSYHFGRHSKLLHLYDQHLEQSGHDQFSASASCKTTLDWCVFSCDEDRVAGNVYQGEKIEEVGDLFPRAKVEKIGRSTGRKSGQVNEVLLQHWGGGESSFEIAIIGDVGTFATVGDSGGCVFVDMDGNYKAAGMLIGKNALDGITFATPLRMLLDSAGDYVWA